MPADPPDVDFLVAGGSAGIDEDLPEPSVSPWWLRARVPLGVAAAVALLAGLLFRVTSSGSGGAGPAAAPGSTGTGISGSSVTLTFPDVHGDRIEIGPHRHFHFSVPCDVVPKCIVTMGAPDSVIDALKDYLPGVHVVFASTSLDRTGIAGRHHHFRATSVQARRGKIAIHITILHTGRNTQQPTGVTGERETAFGTRVYARAHLHGYFVSIDVTAPTGRIPAHAKNILALATDRRLYPGR